KIRIESGRFQQHYDVIVGAAVEHPCVVVLAVIECRIARRKRTDSRLTECDLALDGDVDISEGVLDYAHHSGACCIVGTERMLCVQTHCQQRHQTYADGCCPALKTIHDSSHQRDAWMYGYRDAMG